MIIILARQVAVAEVGGECEGIAKPSGAFDSDIFCCHGI